MNRFSKNRLFILVVFLFISFSAFGNEDWQHDAKDLVDSINSLNKHGSQSSCPTPDTDPKPTEREKWLRAGFGNPSIDQLDATLPSSDPKKFTHEIKLTMVLLRNSGWDKEQIKQRLTRVADIYSQCGIKVASAKLVTVDAPNGWVDVDYRVEKRDLKIATMTPTTDKPILFYVRSSREGQIAYAWNQSKDQPPPLTNTAWLTSEINTAKYKKWRDPAYNTEAHELGHIFGDCGHNTDGSKNFLAGDVALLNDKIQPKQCESMKKHNLVRPL